MSVSPEKSTIVRTSRSPKTRIDRIRPVFGALERVAPGLGARWAWRLWCTPTRPSEQVVAKSRAGGMGEVLHLPVLLPDWTGPRPTGSDGMIKPKLRAEIAVESLGPDDGPVVYLLHGWSGWRGQFAPIGRALAAAGYRAVLIDAPNHGDSGPGTLGPGLAMPMDFVLALTAAVEHFGPAHAVVGHSLGGGCAALSVLDGLKAERAVFLSPAGDPVAFTRQLARMLGFGERVRTRMIKHGLRRTGLDAADFVVPPRALGRTDLPAALIVHDSGDPTVPASSGRALAGAWHDARMVQTSGLGHNRLLRDERVVEHVVAFIAGAQPRISALGSASASASAVAAASLQTCVAARN